ncbi:MAG: DNA repair protein RecO [Armatimonadota bacterium]|nr:DNA repair protein RecO [Armatimonadota bacterium]
MAVYRANGIVLRRTNFGETDRILTLYTREHGRLSAIAKGSRRPVSRLAAATELFNYGRYLLATGRNLDVVTQSETRESFPNIRNDIHRIAYSTYIVELVNGVVEDRDPNYELFDTILSCLYLLEGGVDPEIVTRSFELQLMMISGYRPHLESCARCGAPPPKEKIGFSPSVGGVVCENCGDLPEDTIPIHRQTLDMMAKLLTAEPAEIRDLRMSNGIRVEMANVMRWYIRYRLERELKSSEFIQALKSGANK